MQPNIQVIHGLPPEDGAMLQALYSRSPASVDDHLGKLNAQGSGPFMDRYYVGYGHQSIGDCGSTTFYIEGVTMLVAKAIQDWPLYSGQESSTRYMDFSSAEFFDPVGALDGMPVSSGSHAIQERWREFYLAAREPTEQHLLAVYPRQPGEDEKTYERAIKARVFDILRSFLPAGAMTNLSWHTNLRQASDHLAWLLEHPDMRVRDTAEQIFQVASRKYPSSFRRPKTEHAAYYREAQVDTYYLRYGGGALGQYLQNRSLIGTMPGIEGLTDEEKRVLRERPKGAPIPWYFAEKGMIHSGFDLDFGSFRDLQRHRAGTVRMPLLTTARGFHPWYLQQLPDGLAARARLLLQDQEREIATLPCPPTVAQNYVAMGYRVPCEVTQPLPAFVYRLELRSSKTVHPTLRAVVLEEIRRFRLAFPDVPLHVDTDPDSWTIRRGSQTIEEKS